MVKISSLDEDEEAARYNNAAGNKTQAVRTTRKTMSIHWTGRRSVRANPPGNTKPSNQQLYLLDMSFCATQKQKHDHDMRIWKYNAKPLQVKSESSRECETLETLVLEQRPALPE